MKDEPLILGIETATRAGSVAIAEGKRVLSFRLGDATISHSSNLIEMIQAVFAQAGRQLSDVDLYAAAIGPGSFTGLRIGLATVKAFAACTGRQVAAVSTLAAIAHSAGESERTVSVLPAGRGEVFAQMFCVEDSNVRPLDNAAHITPGELRDKYPPDANMRWAGDAERVFGIPSAGGTTNCLATSVAALGLRVYREGNLVSAEELRAEYVRASDAEINERWQQQKAKKPV